MNKIISVAIVPLLLIVLSSCKTESAKDINELIKTLNTEYGYTFTTKDFIIEKRENAVYHHITDNGSLLSLYSNKENEIIQCTLSSFDINNQENSELIINIGIILLKQEQKVIKSMLYTAEEKGKCVKDGWNIAIIKNKKFVTYLINRANSEINNNNLPTIKSND